MFRLRSFKRRTSSVNPVSYTKFGSEDDVPQSSGSSMSESNITIRMTNFIEQQLNKQEMLKDEISKEVRGMKEELLAKIAANALASNSVEAEFYQSITESAIHRIEARLRNQEQVSDTILNILREQNCVIRNWIDSQASRTHGSISKADHGKLAVGASTAQTLPGEVFVTDLACREGVGSDVLDRRDKDSRLNACIQFATFNGDFLSEDAECWLARLELYFEYCHKADQEKISFAALHLVDAGLAWWLDLRDKVSARVRDPIVTWGEFKKCFAETFFPEHTQLELRKRFYGLVQRGSVEEYTGAFWRISLRLKGFPDKQKLLKYIYGLKEPLQEAVMERCPQSLCEAFYLAKAFETPTTLIQQVSAAARKPGFSAFLHNK